MLAVSPIFPVSSLTYVPGLYPHKPMEAGIGKAVRQPAGTN